MIHKPFNRYFWLTLVAVIFAGGLIYGQAVGLNDVLDQGAATVGNTVMFTPERVEFRHIDTELQALFEEPLEDDFSDVDAALEEF